MDIDDITPGVNEVSIDDPSRLADGVGLVLKWRRNGDILEGLVSCEVGGGITSTWMPALNLTLTGRSVTPTQVQAAQAQAEIA